MGKTRQRGLGDERDESLINGDGVGRRQHGLGWRGPATAYAGMAWVGDGVCWDGMGRQRRGLG